MLEMGFSPTCSSFRFGADCFHLSSNVSEIGASRSCSQETAPHLPPASGPIVAEVLLAGDHRVLAPTGRAGKSVVLSSRIPLVPFRRVVFCGHCSLFFRPPSVSLGILLGLASEVAGCFDAHDHAACTQHAHSMGTVGSDGSVRLP